MGQARAAPPLVAWALDGPSWARLYSVPVFAYAPAPPAVPGYVVAAGDFVGLVNTEGRPGLVDQLHAVTGLADATVADVLDLLEHTPPLASFALVEVLDRATRRVQITVRGDVQVDLGGSTTTRFQWPGVGSWVTGEASGVEVLAISLTGRPEVPANLPIARGAIAASHVSVDLRDQSPREAAEDAHTIVVSSERSSPAREEAAATRTVFADILAGADEPAWTLTLPDGNELEAAPQIVVGRRPWHSDPDDTQTYYIVAPSPRREISGKHVEFTVVGGELFARDMDSTNGTVIESPHMAPRLLHGGSATPLAAGDTLDLGDGFRIVVGTRR